MIMNCTQCCEKAVEGLCELHWQELEAEIADLHKRIKELEADNARLVKCLDEITCAQDWLLAGYTEADYVTFKLRGRELDDEG